MLDIRLIRDRPEEIERALAEKGGATLVKELVESDVVRRRLIHESEELKAEHGRASQEMGKKQGAGGIPADAREAMRARSDKIKMLDAQVKEADEKVHALLLEIPNVPHPSVPRGTSDTDNVEVRRWGTHDVPFSSAKQFDASPVFRFCGACSPPPVHSSIAFAFSHTQSRVTSAPHSFAALANNSQDDRP